MRKYQRISLLFLTALAVAYPTAIAALHDQNNRGEQIKQAQKSREMIEAESAFPTADYEESEPADPYERSKRRAKGRKYDNDKSELAIDPYSDVVTVSSYWAIGLNAIPVDRSAAIIVGNILAAQAHLSSNKKKVYSEFTVDMAEVLKNDSSHALQPRSQLAVDRIGGRVNFPSGKVGLYFVTGQNMPRVGGRYLLFLTQTDQESGFSILTGYELRDGLVYLLDNPGGGHPVTEYQGRAETVLLQEVRAATNKQQ